MTTETYPGILPCFNATNYSYQQFNTVSTTQFQSGRQRMRRRFKDVPVTFKLSATMTTVQLGIFEAWRHHNLQDIGWFYAKLKTGTGIEDDWKVRFIASDHEPKLIAGNDLWEVSFVAQAEQQRYMPAGDVADFIESGSLTFGDQAATAVAPINTSLALYYTGYIQ